MEGNTILLDSSSVVELSALAQVLEVVDARVRAEKKRNDLSGH